MWKSYKFTARQRPVYVRLLSALLCLLLLFTPVQCMAATVQLTEQEQQRLNEIFNELSSSTEILLSDSTKSALLLIQALKQLEASKKEIEYLKSLLMKLQAQTMAAESDLKEANALLAKASESFKQHEKEVQKQIKSLKAKNMVLGVVGGVLLGALVYQSFKAK